ncbi:RHS repeat-associated core domain-containing protein [Bacillus sp. FDAARGOS_235]|uniref:RHS repeat-associated core domain-containing protein n=1 Tax=Bacillus sp. FDAARGOS_235 TaxID=1839798 RepID=UPI0011A21D77|nr:RHS repeat-associated core domain-containing protein [Bacillus sp. FDAARGOS_235]
MASTQVFSQAFNFRPLSSSVNNRTRCVNANITLGTISSGLQNPATFTLALNYNPGSRARTNFGFGENWTINTPRLDLDNDLIYLSNGLVEKVLPASNGTIKFLYHKVDDCRIETVDIVDRDEYGYPIGGHRDYRVKHKNGTIEYFDSRGLITKLVSASGHYLNFTYETELVSQPLLQEINDGSGNKITVTYLSGRIEITQTINSTSRKTTVYKDGNKVTSISLPNDTNNKYEFEYNTIEGSRYISKISQPNGSVQKFTYEPIKYSNDINAQVVKKLTITGKNNEPSQEITYSSSGSNQERNFTGYKSDSNYVPVTDVDNCILHTDDYKYQVTETYSDIEYTRVFNRFHLLVTEYIKKPGETYNRQETTYEYNNIISGANINGQTNKNFSFWTKKTITYKNSQNQTRSVHTTQSVDIYGNQLEEVKVSGVKVKNVYYPATGEGDNCPSDPNGFVNYLKSSTISAGIHTPKTIQFAYRSVTGLTYVEPITYTNVTPNMVLVKNKNENGIVTQKHIRYFAATDTSVPDKLYVGSPKHIETGTLKTDFTYSHNGDRLTTTTKLTSGSLEKQSSVTILRSTGLVAEEKDYANAVTKYSYDDLNRLTKKIAFAGTSYEQVETYSYGNYSDRGAPYGYKNAITKTLSSGKQFISYVDHNNQLSHSLEVLEDGSKYCTTSIGYDVNGLKTSETEYDKVINSSGSAFDITNTTTYIYDVRNLSEIRYSNGEKETITRDAVANTETRKKNSQVSYTTKYNNYDAPVEISHNNNKSNEKHILISYRYDGFGRNTKTTNALNGSKTLTYDTFDRVENEVVKGATDSQQQDTTTYTYDSKIQNMNLPIKLECSTKRNSSSSSKTVLSSTREYDVFGRLTSQTSPTHNRSYSYDQSYYKVPSKTNITGNTNNNFTSEVLNATTLQLEQTVDKDAAGNERKCTYEYYNNTGLLKVSKAYKADGTLTSTSEYTYDKRGLLTKATVNHVYPSANLKFITTKTYSTSGKRLASVKYEITDNNNTANNTTVEVKYVYDSLGRLKNKSYIRDSNYSFMAVGSYTQNGSFNNEISQIEMKAPQFTGDMEKNIALLEFTYNSYGNRDSSTFNRYTNSTATTQELSIFNRYGTDLLISEKRINWVDSDNRYKRNYTYSPQYMQLNTATRKKNDTLTSTATYGDLGVQRLSSDDVFSTRTYTNDRINTLKKTTDTNPVTLTYDSNGNITKDAFPSKNRSITYSGGNNIIKVVSEGVEHNYFYDASARLVNISNSSSKGETYLYDGDELIAKYTTGNIFTFYFSFGDIPLGSWNKTGNDVKLELYGTDMDNSVLVSNTFNPVSSGARGPSLPLRRKIDYTEFGESNTQIGSITSEAFPVWHTRGFKGNLYDYISDTYMLGNGTRAYSPNMKTFLSQDILSPFGVAGVNRYQFANLDPINNSDPSGLLSTSAKVGIGLAAAGIALSFIPIVGAIAAGALTASAVLSVAGGVAGIVGSSLGIASYATEYDEELSRNLGYASLAFGIASLGLDAGAFIAKGSRGLLKHATDYLDDTQHLTGRVSTGTAAYIPASTMQTSFHRSSTSTFIAHGGAFNTLSGSPKRIMRLSSGKQVGNQVARTLNDLQDTSETLIFSSCHSAVGGTHASQAQVVANITNRNVVGFRGSIVPGQAMSRGGNRVTFYPQSGAVATRTNILNTAASLPVSIFLHLRGMIL